MRKKDPVEASVRKSQPGRAEKKNLDKHKKKS
jgi:hypothetical protein